MVSIPAKRGTLEYFKLEGKIFENWSQNQSLPGRQMDGYDKLAAFIAADPRLSMFRRFSFLETKNLLYLQAELVNLETQLRDIVLEDIKSGDAEKDQFPYSVWHLKRSFQLPGARHPTQWLKVLEIRKTLKEYSTDTPHIYNSKCTHST
jgi:hypothetical protein